ncbi:hypothetical protein [Phenylobacterium sp.]|uniref:hypothetical protein n=1 Tax=Phenylobacterium sp. TaxID=1871053 RepID=UPI0027342E3B|nr:hypothetical protein [Phenylobacterium sp.]MDP3855339.1 hypothetical protein [Phenylobacterium sp.]
MRVSLAAAVAVAALGWTSGAIAQESLQPFEFKQLNTKLTLQEALQAKLVERCYPSNFNGIPIQTCSTTAKIARSGIAGYEMYGEFVSFDDVGLVTYKTAFLPSGLATIGAAFEAKYGAPCTAENSTLQNKFGATFDQTTRAWCFADGQLQLKRYSERNLQRSSVDFIARRLADRKPPTPPVNF